MLSSRSLLRAVVVLAAACLGAAPSHAGVITYTDYSSWMAAISGPTTVTIPDPGLGNSSIGYDYFGYGNASVTYSDVVFSTSATLSDGNFFNVGLLFSGDPAVLSSQGADAPGVANILATLPSTVSGFAFNYGTFGGSSVTFLLSNGDIVTQGSTGSGYAVPNFFGVTDTSSFNSVLTTSSDFALNVNDVSFGALASTDSTVPEPATWLLLAGGLAAAGLLRRRRVC